MSLSYSPTGPTFPGELIDALLAGDVVFLCGTGISAPQLPTFQQLVDRTAAALDVPLDPSEQAAYDEKRYEEVLGSLARRLARRTAMVEEAARQLAVPEDPNLDQHKTVLRLSRDIESRVLIVTTNFDTLLERALATVEQEADIVSRSYAGQALPAPGGADFAGIIHIHGRLEDAAIDLEATPLVLTSAEYGDAYMRSGWASRFLFDLARCKTIVLIGYSAGDAPVRYFLNVLAADRNRFPDLKQVYAFDFYDTDPAEAENRWGTVAVIPIPYCRANAETSAHDHSPLWKDLAKLADLVEQPRERREDRLKAILAEPAASVNEAALAELRWLISGHTDLWSVVIDSAADPSWFTVFQENGLWSEPDACWVIAAWVAKQPQDKARFVTAVEWLNRLGPDFQKRLAQPLSQAGTIEGIWRKAWRQFGHAQPAGTNAFEERAIYLKQTLESDLVLEEDLLAAIRLLSPRVQLRKHHRDLFGDGENEQAEILPKRLADLVWVDFGGQERHTAGEILTALDSLAPLAERILLAATAALRTAAWQAVDLDLILDDADAFEGWVPSIEEHAQNDHHDGPIFLVRAIVQAFETVVGHNRAGAREMLEAWRAIPGLLGVRLCQHALRNTDAFDPDEAMRFLAHLGDDDFWLIRRETALLLLDRAAAADSQIIAEITDRIIGDGSSYYDRYELRDGQPDWRPYARDNDVWLRLEMLRQAGALNDSGSAELAAIKQRREHLDRAIEDRDFFSSYLSSVRMVTADTAPIEQATPDDRLRIVLAQERDQNIEQRQGWGTFCRMDPAGAFETLTRAELCPENLGLWRPFLSALCFGEENSKAAREELAVAALACLADLHAEQLGPIAEQVVDLFLIGPRLRFVDREGWYDRLWGALCLNEEAIEDPDLADGALNRPAGRLAQILSEELEVAIAEHADRVERQRARLVAIASAEVPAAIFARATMVRQLGFLIGANPALIEVLKPRLANGADAPALRRLLVWHTKITPALTNAVADEILQAAVEEQVDDRLGETIAAGILRPAFAEIRNDLEPQWGISAAQVRHALRSGPATLRRGAIRVVMQWMVHDEGGPEQGWEALGKAFLDQLWPKEARFVEQANSGALAELAVSAGTAFPAALAIVRDYIQPRGAGHFHLYAIKSSGAPKAYPRQTLDLLWLLCGPTAGTSYDMPDILNTLVEADPSLAVDRRLQSLNQRAMRF